MKKTILAGLGVLAALTIGAAIIGSANHITSKSSSTITKG